MKRVFLIVLDSVGIGELPDAAQYGDEGSNTLLAASKSSEFHIPNMKKLGLLNIDGVREVFPKEDIGERYNAAIARLAESSVGKDTTTGHWEIAGVISKTPFPTYPNGFPKEIIEKFEERTGKKTLCNLPYSGTEVIKDYGLEHMETGDLIVYTSADSVFQIAAHEEVVPIEDLYKYCEIAREILQGDHAVGRVIARPFMGVHPNYTRTSNRHDYSLAPPKTMLDYLKESGFDVLGIGKINDIFAGKGLTETVRTADNMDGIEKTIEHLRKDFTGLCFVNLVDFDAKYGHRNDVDGYAKALSDFDRCLPRILEGLRKDDIVMITADHGCDPSTPSTDHSREYVPLVVYGKNLKKGINLGTRRTFADISATILDYFDLEIQTAGNTFLDQILVRSPKKLN